MKRFGPFGWTDFELDDSTDEVPDKHVLFIWEGDATNELAVIVHRASEEFPIDGELANQKRANAEYIVQALTAFAAAPSGDTENGHFTTTVGLERNYSAGCGPGGDGQCDGHASDDAWCDCSCHELRLDEVLVSVEDYGAWHRELWAQYEPGNPYLPVWVRA